MKKFLNLLALLALVALLFAGCKPKSSVTPQEALCGALSAFRQSIEDLQELDNSATRDDLEKARDFVVSSFQQVQWAAEDMAQVNTDLMKEKLEDLDQAVKDLAPDTPIDQAVGLLDEEISALLGEISVVASAAKCP
jgi:hypothetical protein